MGLAELLTIVFVVLKLTGVIDWSWWLVLLPEIIAILIYTVLFIIIVVYARMQNKIFMSKYERAAKRTRNKHEEYLKRRQKWFENHKLDRGEKK
ncbi:hypothetical protein LO086_001735 [Staphylococcus pseudintermedius]|nr:hypothetical protein [Staphylococcus pseudintermedius]EIO0116873.1 hypothetical protein [Staphylococcus pseudintermedius]